MNLRKRVMAGICMTKNRVALLALKVRCKVDQSSLFFFFYFLLLTIKLDRVPLLVY